MRAINWIWKILLLMSIILQAVRAMRLEGAVIEAIAPSAQQWDSAEAMLKHLVTQVYPDKDRRFHDEIAKVVVHPNFIALERFNTYDRILELREWFLKRGFRHAKRIPIEYIPTVRNFIMENQKLAPVNPSHPEIGAYISSLYSSGVSFGWEGLVPRRLKPKPVDTGASSSSSSAATTPAQVQARRPARHALEPNTFGSGFPSGPRSGYTGTSISSGPYTSTSLNSGPGPGPYRGGVSSGLTSGSYGGRYRQPGPQSSPNNVVTSSPPANPWGLPPEEPVLASYYSGLRRARMQPLSQAPPPPPPPPPPSAPPHPASGPASLGTPPPTGRKRNFLSCFFGGCVTE